MQPRSIGIRGEGRHMQAAQHGKTASMALRSYPNPIAKNIRLHDVAEFYRFLLRGKPAKVGFSTAYAPDSISLSSI